MSYSKFGKVAVLCGGESNEREISIQSGQAVFEALRVSEIEAFLIDPKINSLNLIDQSDRAFICLHGQDGEDGKIQSFLDKKKIPYTGSNAKSSRLGMDKFLSKSLWVKNNINTPAFLKILPHTDFRLLKEFLGLPFFLKPANSGSSLGVSKIVREDQFRKSFEVAYQIDSLVIGEAMVHGREFTLPILNNLPLPIVEICPKTEFYDYDAKYNRNDTTFICPTDLDEKLIRKIEKIALNAFNHLGCSGWGRVDFMIDNEDNIYIIEVNTIPGMTNHSLVPFSASKYDISFEKLVIKILDTSFV